MAIRDKASQLRSAENIGIRKYPDKDEKEICNFLI